MPPEVVTPPPRSLQAIYDALMARITGRRSGGDCNDGDHHAGDNGADLPDTAALVEGDARASAAERLHVYEHMYRARIVEALDSQFPRLARWVGAEAFAELAATYIADEPSRHPSLRFIGRRFPEWLAKRPPDETRHPALAELARLEWARADVFDAEDTVPLAIETVRAWPVDRFGEIPLRLVGAHRRLRVVSPVAALWDAIGPAPPANETITPLDTVAAGAEATGGESLLVWRQGTNVFHRATDDAETAELGSIAGGGTTFGAICEALSRERSEEEATAQAFAWLSSWTIDELLAAP